MIGRVAASIRSVVDELRPAHTLVDLYRRIRRGGHVVDGFGTRTTTVAASRKADLRRLIRQPQ